MAERCCTAAAGGSDEGDHEEEDHILCRFDHLVHAIVHDKELLLLFGRSQVQREHDDEDEKEQEEGAGEFPDMVLDEHDSKICQQVEHLKSALRENTFLDLRQKVQKLKLALQGQFEKSFCWADCSYTSSLRNSSRDQLESQLVIMSAKLAKEEDRIFEFINQSEDKFCSLFSVILRAAAGDRVIVSYAAASGVCQQHYPNMKLTTRTNTAVNALLLYLYDEIRMSCKSEGGDDTATLTNKSRELSQQDVQDAVRHVLPGNLAEFAVDFAVKKLNYALALAEPSLGEKKTKKSKSNAQQSSRGLGLGH
jgi:hypothetical protein